MKGKQTFGLKFESFMSNITQGVLIFINKRNCMTSLTPITIQIYLKNQTYEANC